ncbi:MAG: hypothetical protein FWD63_00795 [Propionibacteriaceae bacterium]|nr:hypothetical protein [Propionibacteriaceae bacterium]
MPHNHRFFAGFALALLTAVPLTLAANTASASPPGLDYCVQQQGVYVVVTKDEPASDVGAPDALTFGVCILDPGTGTNALKAAGVTITRDATGMICALNNYPNPCPATFDGKYWQYYQASAADAEAGNWTYATTGSDDSHTQPGWVEGWCYGEQCTPVLPTDVPGLPTPSDTPTTTAATSGPGATIAVVGVIVVLLVVGGVVLVRQRRR